MPESARSQPSTQYDDEIDLRALFRVVWAGKWLITGITVTATILSVIYALHLPNVYRAEALLASNQEQAAGGLSALAAQYGGLASLAGIDLGSGAADKTAIGLEILKSRKFISDFIERHDILIALMAAKGWDSTTGDLKIDPDAYDLTSGKWVRQVSPPKKTVPSMQEAYKKFSNIFSVNQDKESGFVTVAVEFYSPGIAKQWVDWVVEDINSSIMRQDVAEAEQAIEYLNRQIESTSLADLQNVFFKLIEEQTKTVMLAKVIDEYVLKTLDPAIAPEVKSKPKRSLIVILSALLSFFFAAVAVLVSTSFRKEKAG